MFRVLNTTASFVVIAALVVATASAVGGVGVDAYNADLPEDASARERYEGGLLGLWRVTDGKCNNLGDTWSLSADTISVGGERNLIASLGMDGTLIRMAFEAPELEQTGPGGDVDLTASDWTVSREGDVVTFAAVDGEEVVKLSPCTFGGSGPGTIPDSAGQDRVPPTTLDA
ncbi:MAG: hypothetical protein AAFO93_06135 [Pseudomonadota bacterium]